MAFPSDSARTKNWGTEVLTDADLEAQLDLLHNYFIACLNASTGHAHDGTSNQGPKLSIASALTIASQAQGDTIYASSSSAWARLAKGTANQLLTMNSGATAPEWKSYSAYVTEANALSGSIVQVVSTQTGAVSSGTTVMVDDDTIPQNTEGDEYMTRSITPNNANNKLLIEVIGYFGHSTNLATFIGALFQDSTAGALAAGMTVIGNSPIPECFVLRHYMTAGTTSSTTFKFRAGGTTGTTTFNGETTSRRLGGVMASSITIKEIKV